MANDNMTDGMLDVFLYESEQMLEQLESVTLTCQKEQTFSSDSVNEIFRVMHTIKGSSGIMMLAGISKLAHTLEDVFYYIREKGNLEIPVGELIDLIFIVSDFIKEELVKIQENQEADGEYTTILNDLQLFLSKIKDPNAEINASDSSAESNMSQISLDSNKNDSFSLSQVQPDSKFYLIKITYRRDAEMCNVKAFSVVFALSEVERFLTYSPINIKEESSANSILENGFYLAFHTYINESDLLARIDHSSGVEDIAIKDLSSVEFDFLVKGANLSDGFNPEYFDSVNEDEEDEEEDTSNQTIKPQKQSNNKDSSTTHTKQSFISVNVEKMDLLMDLIGELVIAEAVVLQNPDLMVDGLDLTNFNKESSQLTKITSELQEAIMSIRMMPLTNTFQKMNRIVYDTSKRLGKNIELKIIGEGTEVDKNIIEHISDPLMHMIRNAVDHGIEMPDERMKKGKEAKGTIILEAKNEGGKVWISVKDNGKGLSKKSLLKKARDQGLIDPNSEKDMQDKDIYNLITLPGFSTKKEVTEYSGRGVGMDVVMKNIVSIGGSLDINSSEGEGSTMTLKIPLTLAIIDGIILGVDKATYVVATEDVKEFVSITNDQLIVEPDGTESMMLRGDCLPVVRLKDYYNLSFGIDDLEAGIMAILEHEGRRLALFIDRLIGEQEIVVKPIPSYIKRVKGLSGCTQLGNGSISLILDAGSLVNR